MICCGEAGDRLPAAHYLQRQTIVTHRSIRFVHAANWIFASVLGFLIVAQWHEMVPLEARATISVSEDDPVSSAAELQSRTADFAEEQEITFGRVFLDFHDWHGSRTLYLFDGDSTVPGSDWLSEGMGDFSGAMETQVRPYNSLEDDIGAGGYLVFGDPSKAYELGRFLESQGLSAQVVEVGATSIPELAGRTLAAAFGMAVLVGIALVCAGVLIGMRAYGVGRLQGMSYASLLAGDLRRILVPWVAAAASVFTVSPAILALYNGLAGVWWFAVVALAIGLVLTATALSAHALVLLLVMQVPILSAVKGELPARTASVAAYTLRLTTIAVSLVLLAETLAIGTDLMQRKQAYEDYARLGDTASITVGGMASIEEEAAMIRTIGDWLRTEDQAGHVLLAGEGEFPSRDPGLQAQTVLYVNDVFLAQQAITLEDGTEYTPRDVPGVVTVLVPSGLWDRRAEVIDAFAMEAAFDEEVLRSVTFEPIRMEADQRVFTYSTEGGVASRGAMSSDQSYADDPIIVALPREPGLLNDGGYFEFASGGVLFPDPAVAARAVEQDENLAQYVLAITPVTENVAVEYEELMREFRVSAFSALAGVLVLVISGIGAVLIHAGRSAQWIFARHVNGWRYTAVHRTMIVIEAVVCAGLIAWLPYQVWSMNRQESAMYEQAGVPAPTAPAVVESYQWAAIALLAAVAVGGVLIALARAHHRVVREGASEA